MFSKFPGSRCPRTQLDISHLQPSNHGPTILNQAPRSLCNQIELLLIRQVTIISCLVYIEIFHLIALLSFCTQGLGTLSALLKW